MGPKGQDHLDLNVDLIRPQTTHMFLLAQGFSYCEDMDPSHKGQRHCMGREIPTLNTGKQYQHRKYLLLCFDLFIYLILTLAEIDPRTSQCKARV